MSKASAIQAATALTSKKFCWPLILKISARITSNGKVGIQNKYYTQLLGVKVVNGYIIPNRATPVGMKSTNGAHIAASFGSLNKFWSVIERLRNETARSQIAKKSCINMLNVKNDLLTR